MRSVLWARESGIAPGGVRKPTEEPPIEALLAHRDFDRSRHRESVNHRREHREIHRVGGIPDLPYRSGSGVHQQVMGGRDVDEEDVEHEGAATNSLVQGLGADRQRSEQIPDRNHRADVDLLGHVAEPPPGNPVPRWVDILDDPHRPEQGRDHDDCAVEQRDDRDDRGSSGAKDHQRYRALVGLISFRDVDRREVVDHAHQCADGDEDDPEVEPGARLERNVGGHQHIAFASEDRRINHDRSDGHHHQSDPRGALRSEPRVQEHGSRKVEHGDLKIEDPEDQHVEAVEREQAVVPLCVEQMHGGPSGEPEAERRESADQQEDDCCNRVQLDELLGRQTDRQCRRVAGSDLIGRVISQDGKAFDCAGHENLLFDDDAAGHHVMSDSAEFVADDWEDSRAGRCDGQHVVIAR